ncbi:MAG: Phosphoribosyl 1,2-cyclic phosphate 1,2-diphosphodiesterase [Gemmatimonadaceae bacterium]|nr:Phosphoribosyl 1,2-cyclic phosphate 1,2-diphosphodiesterase [Gemmatimonadaceae bacterium]
MTRTERYADLQLHSSASDGSDAPGEVIRRAHALGFAAVALTDHDTLLGLPEARRTADALGVELIPACEISTLDADERQIDVLAYGVSTTDRRFENTLRSLRDGRFARAWGMVQKLNEFGYTVSFDRVMEIAGGTENIGRPHVARAMVEAGVVPDVKSAFTEEFILDGGRCYVQRLKVSPEEAIVMIHDAGGVAVAAHPGRTRLSDEEIVGLVASGLDGIEAFYPQHDDAQTERFLGLAEQHRLLVTGGSDDHGDVNEGRLMGTIRLPYAYVDALNVAMAVRARHIAVK